MGISVSNEMSAEIDIYLGDVSDVEGHVFARYVGPALQTENTSDPILLRGTLRGPYCERAHTLPAAFVFRDLSPQKPGLAKAIVPDPCVWSSELPHLYQVDVAASQGKRVIAKYHGKIGLRRTKTSTR
jgi:hypothetical protein